MDYVNLLISLISGIVGGNVAGAAAPQKSLGTLGNSIAGLFGGGLGGSILNALGVIATQVATHPAGAQGAANLDIASLVANIVGSGVGGGVLTLVAGIVRDLLVKK